MNRHPRRPRRGAALLLAMLVLTLVGTLAAGMVWQQWRALQVEGAERARAQAGWILTGALDVGRVVLRLDARTPGVDHLAEPWATQLQEASLSSLLAQDRNNTLDSAPEAFLSGGVRDAQSRYNLRNLLEGSQKLIEAEVAVLRRLCASAGVDASAADTLATALLAAVQAEESGGENDAPLLPQSVDQLVWLGLDAATVQQLQPFVVLLPRATPLNLNTASRDVLTAVVEGFDSGSAERFVARRPFKSLDEARTYLPANLTIDPKQIALASSFFEVSGLIRMEGRLLEERSLVERRDNKVLPLMRTRAAVLASSR